MTTSRPFAHHDPHVGHRHSRRCWWHPLQARWVCAAADPGERTGHARGGASSGSMPTT